MHTRYWSIATALIAISAALLFVRLDHTPFWDDEAYTAIIARNFLAEGRFTGWDGRNLIASRNGASIDANLTPVTMQPLDTLVCAASFKAFGQSTWTGRFGFALAGMIALGLAALLLRELFPDDEPAALYTLALLGLSTVFQLHVRQCHYYSLSMLGAIGCYFAYRRYLASRRPGNLALLVAAATFGFYANFLLGAVFVVALGLTHLMHHARELRPADWGWMAAAVALFLLLTVPYAVAWRIWERPDLPASASGRWLTDHARLLWWNFQQLNRSALVPWAIAGGLFWLILARWDDPAARIHRELATLALGYIVCLSLFSPPLPTEAMVSDVRYLIGGVPIFFCLTGICLGAVHRRSRIAALALAATLIGTNALTLTSPSTPFRWLLPAYLNELAHDFPTPYGAAVEFLRANTRQDEVVCCWPEFTANPLMFYLGDRLKFGGVLEKSTHVPEETIHALAPRLYVDEVFPDVVVAFGAHDGTKQLLQLFSRPHPEHGEASLSYLLSDRLDVFWVDLSKPDVADEGARQRFGPWRTFDPDTEAIYIYRRSPARQE